VWCVVKYTSSRSCISVAQGWVCFQSNLKVVTRLTGAAERSELDCTKARDKKTPGLHRRDTLLRALNGRIEKHSGRRLLSSNMYGHGTIVDILCSEHVCPQAAMQTPATAVDSDSTSQTESGKSVALGQPPFPLGGVRRKSGWGQRFKEREPGRLTIIFPRRKNGEETRGSDAVRLSVDVLNSVSDVYLFFLLELLRGQNRI